MTMRDFILWLWLVRRVMIHYLLARFTLNMLGVAL